MSTDLSLVELIEAAQKKATVSAFTARLLKNFGGVEGFADAVFLAYDKAPVGSNQQAVLARSIIALMQSQQPAEGEDLADQPLTELQAALTHVMGKVRNA